LKIEIDKITDDPVTLEETVSAKVWGLDNYDVKFSDEIHFVCTFTRFDNEIMVDGTATFRREAICGRCLKEVGEDVEADFKLNYNALSSGEEICVDDDVREQILLEHPMRFLCSQDCKGICAGCGANLNSEKCTCKPVDKRIKGINI